MEQIEEIDLIESEKDVTNQLPQAKMPVLMVADVTVESGESG